MFKLSEKIRRFMKALETPKKSSELEELIHEISKAAPKADPNFQQTLKAKLMTKHKAIQKEEKRVFSFIPFKMNAFAYGAAVLLIAIIASAVSYPMIPAPQVQGYILKNANRQISYNAPIKIVFNQWMDHASAEQNFSIEPNIEGKISWSNNSMIFTPSEQFKIGDSFKVTVKKDAKSLLQKTMPADYIENYVIVKTPEVVLFTPENESVEIPTDAKITVMFDRPITQLTALKNPSQEFPKMIIEPALEGKMKWLGTSSFQFIPTNLNEATTYHVKIPKGVTAIDGGYSEQDFETTFQTIRPVFQYMSSNEGVENYSTNSAVNLLFNQEIDLNSAKEKIKLVKIDGKDEKDVEISLSTKNKNDYVEEMKRASKRIDMSSYEVIAEGNESTASIDEPDLKELAKTIVLKPKAQFEAGANYRLVIASDLKSASKGDLGTAEQTSLDLTTVGEFKMLKTTPYDKYYSPSFEFSSPINLASFRNKISFEPKSKDADGKDIEPTYSLSGDYTLSIDYNYLPSTKYSISIDSGVEDIFGNKLAEKAVDSFETPALSPALELKSGTDIQILDGNQAPIFYLHSTNIDYATVKIKKLTLDQLTGVYGQGYLNTRALNLSKDEDFDQIGRVAIKKEFNKSVYTQMDLSKVFAEADFASSAFYLEVSNPNVTISDYEYGASNENGVKIISTVFLTTRTSLAVKQSKAELLVYATAMKDGKPVEGMKVEIRGNEELNSTTGPDGLARIKIPAEKQENYREYTLIGSKADDWTMVNTSWSEGISPWNFNLDYNSSEQKYFMYLYTDRPIYRPEQEVFFKGILRVDNDAKFKQSGLAKTHVTITDSMGNKVHEQDYDLSKNGTFNGKFTLGKDIQTGSYSLRASVDDDKVDEWQRSFYASFLVNEYRKPEYKLDLIPSQKEYVNGNNAVIDVTGAYYFGAPLDGNDLHWKVKSDSYYFWLPEDVQTKYADSWFSFSDEGYFCYFGCASNSSLVSEGEGKFDSKGKFTIDLPLNIKDKKSSQIYTVEVTAIDKNNQSVSNRVSFPVHQGNFYLGIRNFDYINKVNEPVKFEVLSIKADGAEVTGQNAEVAVYERIWNTVKRKNLDGYFYYENSYDDKLVEKKSVRTAEKGLGQVDFTLKKGGSYRAEVNSKDSAGNQITASTSFYITSSDFINWGRENNDRIELIADKPEYKVGDTAKILIKSPYTGVKALLTQERASVLHAKVIDITSNSQTVEIPIEENDVPNIFVSVLIVKGDSDASGLSEPPAGELDERAVAAFKVGYAVLQVNNEGKKLNIDVKTDKEKYHPGEEVTIKVKTSDFAGKAVPAELSIGVVDESVLSLTETVTADLLNTFYRKRALGVSLAHTLTKALSRVNVQVEAGIKGGGGGNEGVRGEFKDTAHFEAVVKTDANGEGELKFKLPDNLTTWQILTIGISEDAGAEQRTLVGSLKTNFITSKDLLVRPVLSRFMIKDDKIKVGAIVHNYLPESRNVKVKLENNLGLNLAEKSLSIASGDNQKVEWDLDLSKVSVSEAIFTFSALSDQYSDIVEQRLPMNEASFPEYVSTSDVITGTDKQIENVWLPIGLNMNYGKLTITTSPTLAGVLDDGIEYLVSFPYGCVEQLSSAIIPNATIKLLSKLEKFDLSKVDMKALDSNVNKGLQSLYKAQQASGGYGLWQNSESSGYLTAYALYAMNLADKAGYQVDQNVIKKAETYLNKFVADNPLKSDNDRHFYANTRAFVLFVLSENGKADLAVANNLYESKDNLAIFSKAYLAMALNNLSKSADGSVKSEINKKIDALKTDVVNAAQHTPRGVSFEEKNLLYELFDTNNRTSGIVLQMLNRVDKENPLLPKLLSSLLKERRGAKFASTQENSVIMLAMIEYLRDSGELDAAYDAFVTLNGEQKMQKSFNSKNIFENEKQEIALKDLKPDNQDNEVAAWKDGKGNLYLDMNLEYFLPLEQLEAVENGFEVSQEYFALDDKKEDAPLSSLKLGETYRVKLNIVVPESRYYTMVEDFLPAGLEPVDFSLNTSESLVALGKEDAPKCEYWECYMNNFAWYFNHQEMHDDRVMYFADSLPKGVYELEYYVRATSVGEFADLPVQVQETYYPEVMGHNAGKKIVISE